MERNDNALVITGVQQLSTKNCVTVCFRVFFRRTSDDIEYYVDTTETIWNLIPIRTKNPLRLNPGIMNEGLPR